MVKKLLSVVLMLCVLMSAFSVVALGKTADPIISFDFDGNLDSGDYTAEMNGDVKFVDGGVSGKAIEIKAGYLEVQGTETIMFNGNFTFATWYKANDVAKGVQTLVLKPGFANFTDDASMNINIADKKLQVASAFVGDKFFMESEIEGGEPIEEKVAEIFSGAAEFKADNSVWNHIAVAANGTSYVVYINGAKASETIMSEDMLSRFNSFGEWLHNPANILIGYNENPKNKFGGLLDDLKIYDTALTEKEVADLYAGYKKPAEDETPAETEEKHTIVLTVNSPMMTVDGVIAEVDPGRGTAPVIDAAAGRTLVPIRTIVEEMGGKIEWDGADKNGRVDIILGETVIKLWINETFAEVNGVITALDVAPAIMSSRTMLPVRFVTENLKADVEYIPDTQEIVITYTK